jgi:hypothetical protein
MKTASAMLSVAREIHALIHENHALLYWQIFIFFYFQAKQAWHGKCE